MPKSGAVRSVCERAVRDASTPAPRPGLPQVVRQDLADHRADRKRGSDGNQVAPSIPTAAESSPTAAASTSASATPAAATARAVATFSGSGQENTPRFTVTHTWKLVYSFNCSSFGSSGNFQVYEDGGNDFSLSVNDLATSKSSSTWAYNDGGTHYLEINSECSWKLKIVDEP
jgi:hypothetical protein